MTVTCRCCIRSLQYSGIGMAVGHENTHGFDDEGILAYITNGHVNFVFLTVTFGEIFNTDVCGIFSHFECQSVY